MSDEMVVSGLIDVLRAKVLEYVKLLLEEGIKKVDLQLVWTKFKEAAVKSLLVFLEEVEKAVDVIDFGSLNEFVRPMLKNFIVELRNLLLGGVLAG